MSVAASTLLVTRTLAAPVVTTGDVWEFWRAGAWVVIPTNTETRADGTAVMGAGLAKQAAVRFPGLDARYGQALSAGRNRLAVGSARLLLVPTKTAWRAPSSLDLVRDALVGIAAWAGAHPDEVIVVPALGVGLGGLDWADVEPLTCELLAGTRAVILEPHR